MKQAAKAIGSGKPAKGTRVPRKVREFQQAAARGERELIGRFVRKEGLGVDSRDRERNTALMRAAACGKDGGVGKLLELGADPNAVNEYGKTALMMAAVNGHFGTVRILIAYGSKSYLKDCDGKDAFDYAIRNEHWLVATQIEDSLNVLNRGALEAEGKGRKGEVLYYLSLGADPSVLRGA